MLNIFIILSSPLTPPPPPPPPPLENTGYSVVHVNADQLNYFQCSHRLYTSNMNKECFDKIRLTLWLVCRVHFSTYFEMTRMIRVGLPLSVYRFWF